MTDIEDLKRLQTQIRNLIADKRRQAALSGKDYGQMTPRAIQKNSTDLSWLGMDIDKALHEAHAAAVDCGIADARSVASYGPIQYQPSAFHKYRHTPTLPRVVQARMGVKP